MLVSALSFFTIRLFSKESIYTFRLSKRGELVTHDKDQSAINMIEINKLIETNFQKIKLHDSLGEIVKAFEQSKRNLFPIVNDDNQFEGLVFLDDIRKTMCHREFWDTIKAEDVILRFEKDEIIEITKDTPQIIINKFLSTGNYNLPVVKNGHYLGFISRANVFTQYRKLVKLLATD
jgi:CIC family chloride channel protein